MTAVTVPVKGPKGTDVRLLGSIADICRQMARRVADLRTAYHRRDWNLMRSALLVFAEDLAPLDDELQKLARTLYATASVTLPAPSEGETAIAYVERLQRERVEYVREEVA